MRRNIWLIIGLVLIVVLAGCSAPVEETPAEEPMVENEEAIEEAIEEEVMEEETMEEAEEPMEEEMDESNDAMMPEMLEMSYEELSKYTGKDGMPAYVAVDGVIYDVSDVAAWTGGKHHGNMAGNDVTDAIKNKSPHGVKNLEGLPVVGKIVE